MSKPDARPGVPRGHKFRLGFAFALLAMVALAPATASADTAGGQASAYLAYRASVNGCSIWSPLFYNNAEGWTSTTIVHNEGSAGVTVDFHMRALVGGGLITRSISIPANSTRPVTGADLQLPDGFKGALAGTANPCGEISAVTYHDAAGRNRITLESPERAATNLVVPLAFNDYNGWNSMVVVQNANRDTDASVLVTYRGVDAPSVEVSVTVRRDSSLQLDLGVAPKGAITVQLEGQTGGNALVASAYHLGPQGVADGNNGVADVQAARKVFIPLLYRAYNDYNSGVRVVNVKKEGGAQPRITFYDPETNDRVGTIVSSKTLRVGEETTFYLPSIDILQDNRVYSAVVEVEAGGSDSLGALANHVNYPRGTAMLYSGSANGDTQLTTPLLYRASQGLNSGIQVQAITGSQTSVTIRFQNTNGNTLTTQTITVQGNNSGTVYLPGIANLPDGYVGAAVITASSGVTATVNTVRYANPPSGA